MEGHYALVDGKKLRYGYTTGTCAAAAAKGATLLLLTGHAPEAVSIHTPKGIDLKLPLEEASLDGHRARCAVRKFSGDDPDVTDGVLVYARVRALPPPEIVITGGVGVGRVTKPGLK
ncbi:MAG: cobalt-precorrin-5B (C(1))-methyltransferase, partial [Clostridia bacterium]|nr:cobalt-precorrin-5B (C(1))-methyltransferase [Clostridia bacterium]